MSGRPGSPAWKTGNTDVRRPPKGYRPRSPARLGRRLTERAAVIDAEPSHMAEATALRCVPNGHPRLLCEPSARPLKAKPLKHGAWAARAVRQERLLQCAQTNANLSRYPRHAKRPREVCLHVLLGSAYVATMDQRIVGLHEGLMISG